MQSDVIIRQEAVGPYRVNTYLLACGRTKKGVLIDPGGEAERIIRLVREEGVEPVYMAGRLRKISTSPILSWRDNVFDRALP
jgi:hypothetical protein